MRFCKVNPIRNKKLIEKSLFEVDKELDLVRFIRRMRMNMIALMGLLTANQRIYVQKVTRNVILPESSDALSNDSLNASEIDNSKVSLKFFQRSIAAMVQSKNKADKRFVDLFRLGQARYRGVRFGYNSLKKAEDDLRYDEEH